MMKRRRPVTDLEQSRETFRAASMRRRRTYLRSQGGGPRETRKEGRTM